MTPHHTKFYIITLVFLFPSIDHVLSTHICYILNYSHCLLMNEDSSKNGWTSQYGNVTMDIASIIF